MNRSRVLLKALVLQPTTNCLTRLLHVGAMAFATSFTMILSLPSFGDSADLPSNRLVCRICRILYFPRQLAQSGSFGRYTGIRTSNIDLGVLRV